VTIRVSTVGLTGDEGGTEGVILQIADVTEILSLERRLRNAEKLAALHTLSAGVAHEIRNPLSALDLNLHLLEEELRDHDALRGRIATYVEVVNVEIRRLQGILDNFLKFAKPSSVEMREVRLKDLVDHIVQLFQHEIDEKGIKIETQAGWGAPKVLGDETQLSQVLVNIMVNAVQSMPRGGAIRIAVNTQWLEGEGWVEVLVQDTGVGIKREDLRRLFEPFYSTKPNGSGLGLAIAYRIVEDHHGQLNVTSEEGRGTTVTVRLPALEEVAA
jgi:signal transduction histidine kinase